MNILGELNAEEEILLKELMKEKYKQRYFRKCRYIWKKYVPANGQSEVLQGEMLRCLEKLRYEAQNNGNINWDEDFEYFCDFLADELCRSNLFSDDETRKITAILKYFKSCGKYAEHFYDKMDDNELVNVDRIAYTDDNLYDIVADAIGYFQAKNSKPIPFIKNNDIMR